MSVTAEVVLVTARTFLNDDEANLWTDQKLLPKLAQAHRELQVELRSASSPVTRAIVAGQTVSIGSNSLLAPIDDLIEPINLWEKGGADIDALYIPMTEAGVLPNVVADDKLHWWTWYQESIRFNPSTAIRLVKIQYVRSIPVPTAVTDFIGFINGELFLAPRVAAIAAGSVGMADTMSFCSQLASSSLSKVILANRGRMPPASGTVAKP